MSWHFQRLEQIHIDLQIERKTEKLVLCGRFEALRGRESIKIKDCTIIGRDKTFFSKFIQ